ncbi:ROK family protein [Agarivorans sp. B2Z047]|uniref:polyphosphate--glucose phosphotransferase n=1 Tax=Agarivorans sp. B2Z047 TaxID=2652721 RepID=UPI00128DB268|nr:ROK family protein [Agarivorans sp. B2Z047]MPW31418.1 ROK family protein [Agarivorans sp. B2Z047]UQN42461.1 ROK family protein [Agarivorans sp. B2Z047]
MHLLGVDIGGTGIKATIVDSTTGELISERHRIATPQPATPKAVAQSLKQMVEHFSWQGPIGCGFPATVHHGVAQTASNIDKSWIGTNVEALFAEYTDCPCYVVNDADAAGMAEMAFGAGHQHQGVVVIITVGTGLGSAVFVNGELLPNTEFGHIILEGRVAEHYASARVREAEELSWKKWGKRFNLYLQRLEFLMSPDCFIIGGGASKKFEKYQAQLNLKAEALPAQGLNQAGIVGAAMYAQHQS